MTRGGSATASLLVLGGAFGCFVGAPVLVEAFVLPTRPSPLPIHHRDTQPLSSSSSALSVATFATDQYLAQLSSSVSPPAPMPWDASSSSSSSWVDHHHTLSGVGNYLTDDAVVVVDPQTYVHHMASVASDLTQTWPGTDDRQAELWERIAAASAYVGPATTEPAAATAAATMTTSWLTADAAPTAATAADAATATTDNAVLRNAVADYYQHSQNNNDRLAWGDSALPPTVEDAVASPSTTGSLMAHAVDSVSTTTTTTTVNAPAADANLLQAQLANLAETMNFHNGATSSAGPAWQGRLAEAWDGVAQSSANALEQARLAQVWQDVAHSSVAALQQGQQNLAHAVRARASTASPPSATQVWQGAQSVARGTVDTAAWVASVPQQVADGTAANLHFVQTASLAELAMAAVRVVLQIAQMVLSILNILVEAVTGMTVADVVHTAQGAVQDMANSAVSAVLDSVHQLGALTVQEALVSLVSLVVTVTSILFRILSGILELVTGKTAGEWALVGRTAVEVAAQDAVTAARHTATDLSHKSLTELVALLGQWEQHMTDTVLVTASQALDGVSSVALSSSSSWPL
jgi:hypothetical protein